MNKNEYLERLSKLLADISYEEHEEALSYYREYLEDAGAENEQRVIEELGTPEHLAQEIREGLLKKGEPSRRQGEPIRAPKLRTDSGNRSSQASDKTPERSKSNVILIIIAVILTSPLWFPLACAVIGTVFGIIVTAFAIVLSVGIIGIVCTAVGIALIIAGFLACLSVTVYSVSGTLAGAALIGSGLITLALGILFTVLTVWLCGWALPALIHFIRQTISRISCRRKEAHV